ncbi:MAG: choice-of-anchor Q domain-containing protein [Dokdonella sp.]|uniref:choice-of-anchor Q domain-containing protein n=1 Tax=Dokdonella sp. TaxID=2291710 RepID=UPI003F7F2952
MRISCLVGIAGALALCTAARDAAATNAVVSPPNCNEAGFAAALATVDNSGGGTITFNCGVATITFTGYKQVAHAVAIDGGGSVTFDGGNSSAFFQVFASGSLVLKRLTLQHGEFNQSHALENFGFLRLDHVKMLDNASTAAPILNLGAMIAEWSTFAGNSNTGTTTNGHGGVILNDGGMATVRNSTFSGNAASTGGGAIYSTSVLEVWNTTFSGNSTTAPGSGGGAIYQTGNGTSSVSYATFADNTGQTFGGGVYSEEPSVLVVSRSVFSNNVNGNCDGGSKSLISDGYNVWSGATSCPFSNSGDGAGNPMLGALANNGGPTQTRLPGAGSAAINRVPHAQCVLAFDQRGSGRPGGANAACDSGAVEVGGAIDLIFADGFE